VTTPDDRRRRLHGALPHAGLYTVSAESGNFARQSKTDIVLNVDQTATINLS